MTVALGFAVGLTAGAVLVGYETDLGSLVVMGLVTGAALGAAQGLVLAREGRHRLAVPWAVAMPVLFGLGWAASTGIGVDDGAYAVSDDARPIRVYTPLDVRLMLADLFLKLQRAAS